MSTATATEVESEQLGNVLQAYSLHHSGVPEEQTSPQTGSRPTSHNNRVQQLRDDGASYEDPNSISSRRRVPAYRETSRNHSLASRPAGVDAASEIIVPAMFFGVFVQMCLNRIWRATGEKFNRRIFEYKLGGEW